MFGFEWGSVVSNTLGSVGAVMIIAAAAWARQAIKQRRAMWEIGRARGGDWQITKKRRGPVRNLRFTTWASDGSCTSPNQQEESVVSHAERYPYNVPFAMPIERDREVDQIVLSWDVEPRRHGQARVVDNRAQVVPDKRPRGSWRQRFE